MIVCYCRACLPNKVVLGYNEFASEINKPHQGHPYTTKNGLFPISMKGWRDVYVEGDDAQTKANIAANYPDEFA
jgi:hypothetical protein